MTAISIVIPMKDEAENVVPMVFEIAKTCEDYLTYEIIIVDDGSTDSTAKIARRLLAEGRLPREGYKGTLRVIRHDQSGGQSAAVHSGVIAARGEVICTLDGDGQNPPSELPKLFQPLLDDADGRVGLVAGQRVDRQDTLSKRWASRFANGLRGWLLKDGTRDTGCGLKGFRRDAFLQLPYFDHMHRYLPALFKRDGWQVVLVDVSHRERQGGRSKYNNIQRALVGLYDLIGVAWLIRRRKKAQPMDAQDS